MMRVLLSCLALMGALSGCATPLPQVIATGAGTFDIRYDRAASTPAEIDARAQARCAGAVLVETESRFDGFDYRAYRCPGP
jgi:hypothetical protein